MSALKDSPIEVAPAQAPTVATVPSVSARSGAMGDAELADLLFETITKAFSALRAECRKQNAGSGLTIVQIRVLAVINRSPLTNRDLAEDVGLSVAATSRLVQSLIEQNLIAREENPTDRRESFLHLTAAGRNRLKRFRGHVAAKYAEKIALISPAKKKLLAEALPLIGEEITAL